MSYQQYYKDMPLVAILRGLVPDKAQTTGEVLFQAGFRLIEVPLNSPNAFDSIELLAKEFVGRAMIGGGTVISADDVERVKQRGGDFVVSPNCNIEVIRRAKQRGMFVFPGVATPTEAFTALENGADGLKIFPAELIPPKGVKALLTVLPKGTDLIPVGGIDQTNMAGYLNAGATGFGFGSSLFKPSYDLDDISLNAKELVESYQKFKN